MMWQKLGQIYEPRRVGGKLSSHAANPLPIHLNDDVYRIFFSGRDAEQRSSVGHFDFDIVLRQIVAESDEAVFLYGPPDSFYSHGVSLGCCYELGGVRYILFMGWHTPEGGHWQGEIGRLRLDHNLSLILDPPKPFIGLNEHDPISLSYPWVMRETDGTFRIWYGSTLDWEANNGEMLHVIKQARSLDGQTWSPERKPVPFGLGIAQAFSRPTVRRADDGSYQMWFSYRSGLGSTYRIGYAASDDGVDWQLGLDKAGIDVSSTGWDSEMIEYPFVFEHGGVGYMLYNGNGYGRTGIGLAVMRH